MTLLPCDDHPDDVQTTLVSFGFKHGAPIDANFLFDCRFLPNPHWVEELRPLSGLDAKIRAYVLAQSATRGFLSHIERLLTDPPSASASRHLTVALGCTGGRHRSVAMVEELAAMLRHRGLSPLALHRDVEK